MENVIRSSEDGYVTCMTDEDLKTIRACLEKNHMKSSGATDAESSEQQIGKPEVDVSSALESEELKTLTDMSYKPSRK